MDTMERRAMLLLYRKAMRCVGMGQHFFKNKKLFVDHARDKHTALGPTPSPLSRTSSAKSIPAQELALPFCSCRAGGCVTLFSGWLVARNMWVMWVMWSHVFKSQASVNF